MESIVHLTEEKLAQRIFFIRGEKVMLDFDLAELYNVETKRLKESGRRNIERFPGDFLFELSADEYKSLRTQIATLKRGEHSKYSPFAFTEQGVAMLSGILKSKRAIEVNIAIMRTFVHIRRFMESNKELALKISTLEKQYNEQFKTVFDAIRQLLTEKNEPRNPVGFKIKNHE